MNRILFLLLGGDAADPAARRLSWRLAIVGVVIGFSMARITPDPGEAVEAGQRYGFGALILIAFAFMVYECWRYYQQCDEFVRRLLTVSQALAFVGVAVLISLYALFEYVFAFPRPPSFAYAILVWTASAVAWKAAAWKST